ncbi:MAG: hypothetical protein ACRYFR_00810 [Janthinobacterium lividum]
MKLLNKLISTGSTLFTKQFPDYSYGLIRRIGVDNIIRDEHWAEFESIVYSLNSEDLTRLLDGLCLTNKYDKQLKSYFSSEESEVKRLTSGAHNLHLAWERRGNNVGSSLKGNQVDGFILYLEEAHHDLSENFTNPVLNAEASARLIRVYMGFSDTEAAYSAFLNATRSIPNHLLAHLNNFKVTSPKWLGGPETMQSFVNQVANTQLRNLIRLMYLVEIYSDLFYSFSPTAYSKFKKHHGKSISEALATTIIPTDDSLLSIYIRNYLACLYQILGLRKELSAIKNQLKGQRTNYPWAYFGWV